MKNIYKKYFLFMSLGLLLFGCKKDYLDVQPIGVINSGSYYSSKSDAEGAVTAVYGMTNYMSLFDEYIMAGLGSITSDDAEGGGNNPEDTPDFQDVDRFIFTPSTGAGTFTEAYGLLYKGIFFANIAIQQLPGIPKKDTAATQDFINKRLGEVKFLRALDYFYLVLVFGEVPYVDHVLGASEYAVSRSPLKSVFDLMESDLQYAVSVLPTSYDATNIGRATKGAAQGLLAKVLLFESSYAHYYPTDNYSIVNPGQSRFKDLKEKWADALSNAEGVINSGQYELVGSKGERYHSWRDTSATSSNTDGFRYIWTTNGNNSKEAVFETQCEYLGLGWLNTRGSAVVWWTGVRWIFDPKTNKPTEARYWGFNVPAESLVSEFNQEKRQPGDPLFGSLAPADPRFNTTIHKDTIGGNDSVNLPGAANWSKICYQFSPTQYCATQMYQAKYECSYAEFQGQGANWSESPFNIRILRYADIVLVAAEAAVMTGDNEKARTYLNMIRTRARMCGPAGNTCPADYPAGKNITMDIVIHDRRLELAMEGHRFYDLVRWNLATKYLSGVVLASKYTCNFTSPKNDFCPIPQQEVNTSQGHLLQYPGW